MIRRCLEFVKPCEHRIFATIIIGIIKSDIPMLIPLLIKYTIDGVINGGTLAVNEKFHHPAITIGTILFISLIVRPPIEYLRQCST